MFEKLVSFTKKVADLADNPALSASALKAQFDAAPDEVRTYLNKLIDALQSTLSGDSGAKNIGATSISGIDGTDVQTLLENLTNKKANKDQESIINVALIGGATESGGRGIRVFKDTFGLVHLYMDVDLPADTTYAWHVATLPVGYRPAVKITQTITALNKAMTAAGVGEISIETDGRIIIGAPINSSWCYFHIHFAPFKSA